jgi:hypothetical protein
MRKKRKGAVEASFILRERLAVTLAAARAVIGMNLLAHVLYLFTRS